MFSKTKERGDIYICQNFYSAKLKLRNLSNKEKNKPKKVESKKISAASVRAASMLSCDPFLLY